MMKYSLMIMTVLFLTACSVNNMYLYPSKLLPNSESENDIRITSKKADNPTTVVFNSQTLQPTFLGSTKDTIDFDYTIESVVFQSSSGNKLNGWMIKPKNIVPEITLLHFHGNSGSILSQYKAMTHLLNYGFQAFVFDYSGFGFSEGKATRDNVLLDGNSALTYLKSRNDIKKTKLIIYGQSLGGHLSAVVAQQRQTEIDGLVIEGAFSSHDDIATEIAGVFGRMLVKEKYCVYKAVRSYKKPILVIHSTEDKVIPFELGRKIFDNANESKDFYEIKGSHICGPKLYAASISDKIKKMAE